MKSTLEEWQKLLQTRFGSRRLWLGATVVVVALAVLAAVALAVNTVDLTAYGSMELINDAYFIQWDPARSAGTGNFDPYLSIQKTGTEKGINSDPAACGTFDEVCGGDRTRLQLLSGVPQVASLYPPT